MACTAIVPSMGRLRVVVLDISRTGQSKSVFIAPRQLGSAHLSKRPILEGLIR